eukprot:scaffold913_cov71-Cylindrotheca_fusiformis.AAC.6
MTTIIATSPLPSIPISSHPIKSQTTTTTTNDHKSTTMALLLQVTDQKIQDGVGQKGTYTGQVNVDSGSPQGTGTMIYHNNDNNNDNAAILKIRKYQGEWQNGYWHGHGTCELQNGDVYQGEFVQQERHGNGEYTWAMVTKKEANNGQQQQQQQRIYQGLFRQNQRHGHGTYTWKTFQDNQIVSMSTYVGMFDNGQRSGHGVYDSSTIHYVGDWKSGKYHGYGVLTTPDTVYKGYFHQGLKHGKGGIETSTDDNCTIIHQGQWYRDQPVDEITLKSEPLPSSSSSTTTTSPSKSSKSSLPLPVPVPKPQRKTVVLSIPELILDGQGQEGMYKGMLEEHLPQGVGTMTYQQHPQCILEYEGFWNKGMKHGFGRVTYMTGDTYHGDFVNNIKQGQGEWILADGRQFRGLFHQDVPHTTTTTTAATAAASSGSTAATTATTTTKSPASTAATTMMMRVVYPKNDLYLGQYQNGVRSGIGKFTWVDGGYYDGEWKDGLYSGNGELVTSSTLYKGEFQQGSYHGFGRLTNLITNQIVYEGSWKDGLPHHNDNDNDENDENGDNIPNRLLQIPQPPLDYDISQLLATNTQTGKTLPYPKPPDPSSLTQSIMSGLSNLVVTPSPKKQAASSPTTAAAAASPASKQQQQGQQPQRKTAIAVVGSTREEDRGQLEVLDKSVCKAVVDMAVLDGQDHPGRYTGIIHIPTQRPHGVGRMVYEDGNRVHEGFWEYGNRQGHGRCLFVNIGDFHEGSYVQNLRQGPGTYYWKDGRQFVGIYKEDERHGPGVFTYPNGDVYDGNFEHGQRSGFGTFTFHNKTCQYQGEWESGNYNGKGILRWQSVRETRTVDESGEHITRIKCQNRYEGNFENGLFEGEGVEFENDEMVQQGLWSKGKFVQAAYVDNVSAEEPLEEEEEEGVSAEEPLEEEGGVSPEESTEDAAFETNPQEAVVEGVDDPAVEVEPLQDEEEQEEQKNEPVLNEENEVSDENEAPHDDGTPSAVNVKTRVVNEEGNL